ncbi:thioesterase family protein [Mycolicibacterium aichiense]|uniref:thioesterase family protein n=1 Tax=Mycolicibacterium aichiense TaxID=1799 RepID=UPI000E1BE1F7|nr:thioesterase family protein [Mycolicibacterium aichiense]MCV7018758.1 thioesterase family protein [Mycolicibacterium aichiense]
MSYFSRVSENSFRANEHAGGAWNLAEQHIAPSFGLLAHAIETDRDARGNDHLVVARLSYDILGTVPVDAVVEIDVRVLRPGRTIELVEAALTHQERAVVLARAWLMKRYDTSALRGSGLRPIPPPAEMPGWDPSAVWPGGFIASAEVRRVEEQPGRAVYWVRTPVPLLDGEQVSPLARTAGLLDIANGMAVLVDPREVAFPNLDLTAHFFAEPAGDWVGFDTAVSIGPSGIGLTHSIIHDQTGPIGAVSQSLTVRPGSGLG